MPKFVLIILCFFPNSTDKQELNKNNSSILNVLENDKGTGKIKHLRNYQAPKNILLQCHIKK